MEDNKEISEEIWKIFNDIKNQNTDFLNSCNSKFQASVNDRLQEIDALKEKASELPNILASCKNKENEIIKILDNTSKRSEEILGNSQSEFETINELNINASDTFNKIKSYYGDIFGTIRKKKEEVSQEVYNSIDDPEKRITENGKYFSITEERTLGLKDDIEQLIKNYKDFVKQEKEEAAKRNAEMAMETEKLYKHIESLLPGATAAGLSESYYKSEHSSLMKIRVWMGIFGGALLGFVVTGWFLFGMGIVQFQDTQSFSSTIAQLARALFFESPFIWLGVTANVRMAQYMRLNEEYRHKWAMMRVFDGMRSVLNDEGIVNKDGSNIDFYKSLLSMFSDNPSKLLDKKFMPDSPFNLIGNLRPNRDKNDKENNNDNEKDKQEN